MFKQLVLGMLFLWFIVVVIGYVNIFCVVFLLCMWQKCLRYESFYKWIIGVLSLELLMPNSLGLYSSILLILFLIIKLVEVIWSGVSMQKTFFETLLVLLMFVILKHLGYRLLYKDLPVLPHIRGIIVSALQIVVFALVFWLFLKFQQKTRSIKI